jgi:tetratricopeptide (TPR) repeat protein
VAGKRKVFEQALREANNYAWDRQWKKAIAAYQVALAEFPNDVQVRTSLAQAYVSAGEWTSALEQYQQIAAQTPTDPAPRQRAAEILQRLGRRAETIEALQQAAALHESAGNLTKAADMLMRVISLEPNHAPARQRLISLYQAMGKPNAALEQHLAIAAIYQAQGQTEPAIQQVLAAIQINPRSIEARQMLEQLRSCAGGRALPAKPMSAQAASTLAATPKVAPAAHELQPETAAASNPAASARQRALSELAEAVFDHEEPAEEPAEPPTADVAEKSASDSAIRARVDALIGWALEQQTRGMYDEAISNYEQALELGADRPAIHFNLGLLYQEKLRFDRAIEHLSHALQAPEYALGSHFALGECYHTQGKAGQAIEHFIEVLRILDTQNARREQAGDLTQLYRTLAQDYTAEGNGEKATIFMAALLDFLSGENWEDKVLEARRRLDNLSQEGFITSLAELLETPDFEAVLASMGMIQELMQRQMYETATEECYRALALAPAYLPLHMQLADILVAQGRFDDAITKYTAVAQTYAMRGEIKQTMGIYRRVLNFAPMDVSARGKLIQLLVNSGEIHQALEEYISMADAHYRMAQLDLAIDAYNQALQLVPRAASKDEWEIRILRLLGDVYMQSVDWAKARRVYQRIVQLAPADNEARRYLIDLSFKLGDAAAALAQIDALVTHYRAGGSSAEALALLRDLAEARPRDAEVRRRLAQAYLEQDRRAEAIAELNVVGELQLDAANYREAAETVRQLARLEPDKAEQYQMLLNQINARLPKDV